MANCGKHFSTVYGFVKADSHLPVDTRSLKKIL
jgi:beta-glucosidase-like glycosyl hydrolase